MYKLKVNAQTYDLKDGFTIKDEINEELDSGTIIFTSIGKEANIQPFDSAYIYGDNGVKLHLLFNGIDDDSYCFYNEQNNPLKSDHEYTATLFSETKDLERITLPTLRVTQSLGDNKFSVADKIVEFCNSYIPKIKVLKSNLTDWEYQSKYRLDNAVISHFEDIDCPEFQWNNPTLREVLNDLMSTKDCLVTIKDNVISFLDLRNTNSNEIDITKISHVRQSQSSADFATDLTLNLVNAIGKSPTRKLEKGTLRADSVEMTTNNMAIITQHPIYNIRKCVLHYIGQYQNTDTGVTATTFESIDITDRIKEESDFNTLENAPLTSSPVNPNDYKIFNFSYTRSGNQIIGFGDMTRIGVSNYYRIMNVIEAAKYLNAEGKVAVTNKSYTSYILCNIREISFDIEYDSVDSNSLHVGRYLPIERNGVNRLFDQQNTSYVDIKNQTLFEYTKINRLSNKIKTITAEFNDFADIPSLGDKMGDYVLFQREIQYSDNQINFKGFLTPHYILRDWFTGLNSKRRSWQIVSGSEASIRNDIYKYYCEFSFSYKEDKIAELSNANISYGDIVEKLISSLAYYDSNESVKYCLIKTRDLDDNPIPESGYFIVELFKEVEGRSICFNLGFDDNYYAGQACTKYSDADERLYLMKPHRYTDNNGRCKGVQFVLASKVEEIEGTGYNPTADNFSLYPNGAVSSDSFYSNLVEKSFKRPVYEGEIGVADDKPVKATIVADMPYVYKDNAEIYKATIQLEYCADTNDIVVTDKMAALSKLFNDNKYGNYQTISNSVVTPGHDFSASYPVQRTFESSMVVEELIGAELTALSIEQPIYGAFVGTNFVKFDKATGTLTFQIHPRYIDRELTNVSYRINYTYLTNSYSNNLRFYFYSGAEKYEISDLKPLGDESFDFDLKIDKWGKYCTIRIVRSGTNSIVDFNANDKLGICTAEGDLLLGINFSENHTRGVLHASLLRDRDEDIYDDNITRESIGKMSDGILNIVTKYAEINDRQIENQNKNVMVILTTQVGDQYVNTATVSLTGANKVFYAEVQTSTVGISYGQPIIDSVNNKVSVTFSSPTSKLVQATIKCYLISPKTTEEGIRQVNIDNRVVDLANDTFNLDWPKTIK